MPPAAGRGLNFGWDCREGRHAFESSGCPAGGFTEPVLEYSHSTGGCAVTGGYVVRDPGLEELAGRYVYADYCNGEIRSAVLGLPAATGDRSEGLDAGNPSSFGEDSCGRVYVTSLTGEVSRLVDSTPTRCEASPPDPPEPCSQSVRGTHRKDALNGGPGPQSIRGRDGDDRLRGGAGDDCLIGGGGDDRPHRRRRSRRAPRRQGTRRLPVCRRQARAGELRPRSRPCPHRPDRSRQGLREGVAGALVAPDGPACGPTLRRP